MKYLITGGAGFIGGHLAELLLKDENCEKVIIIDDLSTGSLDNIKSIADNPKLKVVISDITDENCNLRKYASEVDCIYHLAAAVGVELVVREPGRTIHTNVHGTENILKAAVEFDKRIIVASTSEVYGKSNHEFFSENDDLLIGNPVHSRWSYACSKLLDEFYTLAYCKSHRLKGTVVRFFNTVGPRQTGQYGMVIPRFVKNALADKDLTVYGDGSQTRCFCHVFDTIRALKNLADNTESFGGIYNIGSQRKISILELAELIIKELNSNSKIKLIPYEEAYEEGFEDMMHRAPDTSKINKLIQWRAEHSLEKVIHDVAKAMK